MKRAWRSFSIIFGVVPDEISAWKPDTAPHAMVMNRNGNSEPDQAGPVPSMKRMIDGIFITGFQPINLPGADGILGTADDANAGPETLQSPGADGIVGTADDPAPMPLTNYQRSIVIAPWPGSTTLRTVTITVRYNTPQSRIQKQYILTALISTYR